MDPEVTRITKFKRLENWAQWKFQLSVILRDEDAIDLLKETSIKPVVPAQDSEADEIKTLADWVKTDNSAQRIIATSVTDPELVHIMNCTGAKEMWKALHNLYEKKSNTSIYMFQQQWYRITIPRIIGQRILLN